MMLTVVTYYSLGTPYVAEVQRMAASVAGVGLQVVAHPYLDRGDWYKNTAYKAEFLAAMRGVLRGPILYVDADAVFHSDPTAYFDGLTDSCDFAAHVFHRPGSPPELLSGTMWINDTPHAAAILDVWVALNRKKQSQGDWFGGGQANLASVLDVSGARFHELPGRYCYVFDCADCYPANEPVVIEHLQASRENRDRRGRVNVARRQRIAELAGADVSGDGYWTNRYASRGCYQTSGRSGAPAHHFYATGGALRELVEPFMPRRNPDATVLEYGCGMGRWVPYLLERHGRYIGLDVAQEAIDRCASYYEDASIRFDYARGIDQVEGGTIDTVFTCTAFQHVVRDDEVTRIMRQLHRVLKPEGRVLMIENTTTGVESNDYIAFRTPAAYIALAADCGLGIKSMAQHVDGERHTIFVGKKS